MNHEKIAKTMCQLFLGASYEEAISYLKKVDSPNPENLLNILLEENPSFEILAMFVSLLWVMKSRTDNQSDKDFFENRTDDIVKLTSRLSEMANKDVNDIIKFNFTQNELFPLFKPQKSVELKKEFSLNFGGLDRIEREYKHLLKNKLSSGLTLQQHIDKVRDWFNNLHGEGLGNWIKLFAYTKAIKDYSENEKETVNFQVIREGIYFFRIKQNKDFFSFFIRPDKSSRQYTTKAKNKFLKWLHDNQHTITFPMIANGSVWNVPIRIYEYIENVESKEIIFTINTNFLDSEFKDFVSLDVSEIDEIAELWEETLETQNTDNLNLKSLFLNSFVDIPLKFLLILKNIYTSEGNYTTESGFKGNTQRLSKEHLNDRLGDLASRIEKHLVKRDRVKTGKSSELPAKVKVLILKTSFEIAVKRRWFFSTPDYNNEVYKFNINPGYFAKKDTAKRLNQT